MTQRSVRPQVAIAHDYLTQRGGAERVVLAMARAFPDAPIYTTLYDPDLTFPEFRDLDVRASKLNLVGIARRHHRAVLPLLPFAASSIKVDADVVLCSSSGWAHGFRTSGKRIVYCYSPARWLYQATDYLGYEPSLVKVAALAVLRRPLLRWDRRHAQAADVYLAISTVIQERIHAAYARESDIVPAPMTLAGESESPEQVDEVEALSPRSFVLCVSRLLPYKNVDRVIEAMRSRPGTDLVVVGRGPDYERLRVLAPPNVHMLRDLSDGQMRWLYSRCSGLVASSYEDFGLTPLEAANAGKPSAVLRAGGYLDTMTADTAVFFDSPSPDAIAAAVDEMLTKSWDADLIKKRAERFSEKEFANQLQRRVAGLSDDGAR